MGHLADRGRMIEIRGIPPFAGKEAKDGAPSGGQRGWGTRRMSQTPQTLEFEEEICKW